MKNYLLNQTIYQVYVRNYTKEGTFKALIEKLDYIESLGVDILYLLPIHEIGQLNKKGSLGCPYSIKDYYSIAKELGTLDDFKLLISEVHKRNMKIMMDIVFNHTSRDSILINSHENYYYHDKNGNLSNKVGDWSDVYDLDHSNDELEHYLIDNIKYWISLGVDGFRFDVCSLIPLSFFKLLRENIGDLPILLGESIELNFIKYMRSIGACAASDAELYQYFDILYPYDVWGDFEQYYHNKTNEALQNLKVKLNTQHCYFPKTSIKINCLENHDRPRIANYFKDLQLKNITAFSFFLKGTGFIYGGQEAKATHLPSLFEKEPIEFKSDSNFLTFIKSLTKFKKNDFNKEIIDTFIEEDNENHIIAINKYKDFDIIGLFNLNNDNKEIIINSDKLKDGFYTDLLTNNIIEIKNNQIKITLPLFLKQN